MYRRRSSKSDHAAWIDDLPEDELRRFLSLGHARLRAQLASPPGRLVLRNQGEAAVRVRLRGAEPEVVAAGEALSLAPLPFSKTSGDPGAGGSRWLSPRARTALVFELAAESGGARVRMDLTGWRTDSARLGAPEVLMFSRASADGREPASLLSYLPAIDVTLDDTDAIDVIVIGRGPEDDAGRLVKGLFEAPAEPRGPDQSRPARDGQKEERVESGVDDDAGGER